MLPVLEVRRVLFRCRWRVGCGNKTPAVSCKLAPAIASVLRCRFLHVHHRCHPVLLKLAYLMLCRFVQLLTLLAHGDAAKDLEILVLRHQLTVLRRNTPRPRLEPADRALLAAISRALPRARWSCFLVKPETLVRWHRQLVKGGVDLPAAWTRTSATRPGGPAADRPPGHRESPLGLPAHQGRAAPPCAATGSTRPAADRDDVAGVPAPAGRRDPRLRLLHRRHRLAATALCVVLHRTGHPPGPPGRRDRQPRRRLGHPAGTESAAGLGRTRTPGALLAARR